MAVALNERDGVSTVAFRRQRSRPTKSSHELCGKCAYHAGATNSESCESAPFITSRSGLRKMALKWDVKVITVLLVGLTKLR